MAFITGILLACLMERNQLTKYRTNYWIQQLIHLLRNILIITNTITAFRKCLGHSSPTLNAIDYTIFSTTIPILLMNYLIKSCDQDTKVMRIFRMSTWTYFRPYLRVSYLIHPVILEMIMQIFPTLKIDNVDFKFALMTICYLVFFIVATFILTFVFTHLIELPWLILHHRLSSYIFDKHPRGNFTKIK